MLARSRSSDSFTSSFAENGDEGSMRMSSGASVAYEKPRSGRSSCMLETPRSMRMASAGTSLPASWDRTTAKLPRSRRVCTPAWRRKRSKPDRTAGSRSIAISFPRPFRSSARSAAWPPAPKVQSTTVSPGRTASSSRTSAARTGTWSVALGCDAFGSILSLLLDLLHLRLPGGAVPYLEVVVDPRDDDVALERGALRGRGRQHHPSLRVRLRLRGAGKEEPLQSPAVG